MDKNKNSKLSGEFILKHKTPTSESEKQEEHVVAKEKDDPDSKATSLTSDNHEEESEKQKEIEKNVKKLEERVGLEHAKHIPGLFSSYCEFPNGFNFENQESDEETILIIRRDFVTNIPWIVGTILLALLPFLLLPLLSNYLSVQISFLSQSLALALFYLMLFSFLLVRFVLWYFNIGIITNKRVRDVDIHGLLYKQVSEARLDFIQDFSYSQIGVVRSIFNYGDVSIQTAGSEPNIEFDRAPNPARIVEIIGELIGIEKK